MFAGVVDTEKLCKCVCKRLHVLLPFPGINPANKLVIAKETCFPEKEKRK